MELIYNAIDALYRQFRLHSQRAEQLITLIRSKCVFLSLSPAFSIRLSDANELNSKQLFPFGSHATRAHTHTQKRTIIRFDSFIHKI